MQSPRMYISGGGRAKSRGLSYVMRLVRWLCCACIFFAGSVPVDPQSTSQTPLYNPLPRPTGTLLPAANRPPDANAQMEMREQQAKQQNFAAANAERKKQIIDDSAKLLKLATDLKAEVDKTDKDTLSLGVIRKADEIEKLAHNVKEKMKLTVGGG